MHDVRDLGIRELVRRAVEAVRVGPVFMAVDVDVLDPTFVPGTGTPELDRMTPVSCCWRSAPWPPSSISWGPTSSR